MKILVTVGTTQFNGLIETIDNIAKTKKNYYVTFQIANGNYKPVNGEYFEFHNNINQYYSSSDLIITHAGAGSIYQLLKLNKKIIIVPNLERVDKHQLDIANYMDNNNYALVCYSLEKLENAIKKSLDFIPMPFTKKDFFKFTEIANYINSL